MHVADYLNTIHPEKLGLVLSGGGVKGIAHIGLLKALEEASIRPKIIAGTSAGALVGMLYAQNSTIDEMLSFFKETPLFKYNFFALSKPGIFDTEKYLKILEKHVAQATFEELAKKLTVAVTDIEEGEVRYFDSGELLRPVLASAALPPIFSPLSIDGALHSDGGIMDNFPVSCIRDKVNCLVGSYTSTAKKVTKKQVNNALKLVTRANDLMLHSNVAHHLSACDVLFRPAGLEQIATLDKKGIDKAFDIGYNEAIQKLNLPHNQNSI